MDEDYKHSECFFIDSKPCKVKKELDDMDKSNHHKHKKRRHDTDTLELLHVKDMENSENARQKQNQDAQSDSIIKASIVYYENVLKDLKKGVSSEMKGKISNLSLKSFDFTVDIWKPCTNIFIFGP